MRPSLCLHCGHLAGEHRRPRVLWAFLGRWACRHTEVFGSHRQMNVAACGCDGWKAAAS